MDIHQCSKTFGVHMRTWYWDDYNQGYDKLVILIVFDQDWTGNAFGITQGGCVVCHNDIIGMLISAISGLNLKWKEIM